MSVIQGNAFSDDAVDTGDIGHSLRFRGTQYLSKTLAAATDSTKGTINVLLKPASFGTTREIFSCRTDANNYFEIRLNSDDTLWIVFAVSGTPYIAKTNRVFRDPTSWINLNINIDSNNATQANRAIVKVSGGSAESFSSNNLIQTTNLRFNSAYAHQIGAYNTSTYFHGYMSRLCFVGDQLKDPTDFGYLNTEINEWVSKSQSAVKAVVDAGGTNSFMLDFDDATSLTTLGYDKSSKGNNWTLNNFSLTAGTTYDHMLDVPGNSYATLNPLSKTATGTLSDGNLTYVTTNTSTTDAVLGTMPFPDGVWWAEVTITATSGTNDPVIGISTTTEQADAYAYDGFNGNKIILGSSSAYGATYTTNDVIFVLFNRTANTLTFYKQTGGTGNFVSQGTITSIGAGDFYLRLSDGSSSGFSTFAVNFGQRPSKYIAQHGALPSSALALCQANLPDVAIKNPKLHFDIKTRTGTAATYSVTGIGFPPDLVWVKSRGRALDHALYDSVRGVQKQLESNSTGAETTETAGLTAFNSDGYTGGALDQINGTTATNSFIDWLWKAGGAAVSNTAGSITSQVSANVDAGFSIVTYTGTGANATVGHGLGKAPGLVIVKDRTAASTNDWHTWHKGLTSGAYEVFLNSTNAQASVPAAWNSTIPSSSVISLGTANGTNQNLHTFVAYCFADIEGYSKAFSYTGNGSADGPYVHLGFKSRWLMLKRTDSTSDWRIYDTVRQTFNQMDDALEANTSDAEDTASGQLDITATGFKLRDAGANNINSGTYIGFAIADVAGKYSLGR